MRNRPFKKTQIIEKQSRALSQSQISEYPGYSLISEPITARKNTIHWLGIRGSVNIQRWSPTLRGIIVLVFAQSVNSYGEFQ